MQNLKNNKNEFIYKTEANSQTEDKLIVTNKKGGRDKLGVSDQQIQTTMYKQINNNIILYSTGNYIQYSIMEKNMKKNIYN